MAQRNKKKGITNGRLSKVASLVSALRNHPQWYEAYPLDHLMGINFGQREKLGSTIPSPYIRPRSTPYYDENITSAPDCVITTELVVPAGSTAFQESMQILMNKLRAASGSNITYTVADLGAYVLNAREIYALYSLVRKIILETRITDIYDQDAPFKYAVAATGRAATTLQSITANLASDTTRVNRLANVISAMIPIRMSLLERTAWMYSNVFADSTTAKFSTKQFALAHTKRWITDPNSPTTIIVTDWQNIDITLTANIDRLEALVGNFTSQTQNSRIAGDLMKAFGAFFTQLSTIDETTKIVPIYDEAALTQIQNCTIVPLADITLPDQIAITSTSTDIYYYSMNQNGLTNSTNLQLFNCNDETPFVVNSYKDSLTPGEIISLTRLVAAARIYDRPGGEGQPPAGPWTHITSCGTEIVVSLRYLTGSSSVGSITSFDYAPQWLQPASEGSMYRVFPYSRELVEAWSRDDWAPMVAPYFTGSSVSLPEKMVTLFDLSNWATLDLNNLNIFHQAAVLSLTATPASIVEQSNFRFIR